MKKLSLVFLICIGLSACNSSQETAASIETESVMSIETEATIYGTDYESTWGDLIKSNDGEPVWGTLTPEQQALVHYPYLDVEKVYWVPDGDAYHSVDWCYTLERSKEILSGTFNEALEKSLNPCSKCIGE